MKKVRRTMSMVSAAVILASVVAMPVSAAEINAYSVSYETLTTAITTEDGSTVPAGAVAVTMSINNNSGFDANTFKLNIKDGSAIMLNEEGTPIVDTGNVLNGAMIGAAENEGLLCVTAAMGQSNCANGELFTVYVTSTDSSVVNIAEMVSVQPENLTEITETEITLPGTAQTYSFIENGYICFYGGDCNNDNQVNSVDASLIMQALNGMNPMSLDVDNYNYANYFPSVIRNDQPDANGDGFITHSGSPTPQNSDAQTILSYAASEGVGKTYTGYGSDTVGQKIEAYKLG